MLTDCCPTFLNVICIISVALFSILSLLLPTVAFTYTEKSWGILDAFYYCFMSLTTIGLGDSIPGEDIDMEQRSLYKILITLYLIFGKLLLNYQLEYLCSFQLIFM